MKRPAKNATEAHKRSRKIHATFPLFIPPVPFFQKRGKWNGLVNGRKKSQLSSFRGNVVEDGGTRLSQLVARPKKVMKSRAPGAEKTGVKACATAAKERKPIQINKKGFTIV